MSKAKKTNNKKYVAPVAQKTVKPLAQKLVKKTPEKKESIKRAPAPKKEKKKPVPPPNINNQNGGGRKLFDGKDEDMVVQKLENAFSNGATDEEACFYADISRTALHGYCVKNPEFRNRKELLKNKLILQARNVVGQVMVEKDAGNLPTNRALETSKWYLERKKKEEFAQQVNGIIDDGRGGGVLTEERKIAIANAMKAWSEPDDEDEQDDDYDGKD